MTNRKGKISNGSLKRVDEQMGQGSNCEAAAGRS